MATQSSINIALSADTSGLNKNMAQAAQTVEQGAKRMAETSQKAGEAIANALGNMSVRDAIKEVSQAINDQKAITLEYQKQLQSLRDKSADMSATDIKGQRALRKEIDAVKAAIAGQKLGIADLVAEKQVLEAELKKEIEQEKQLAKATTEANKASREQKTVNGATRASLNGLATSFSSVSSIMAIVADDNKELRNALMATNAALNFSAAAMQVRDLSKEFGGLGNAAKDVGNWIKANPYLVAAAAITAIGVAIASAETEAEKFARLQAEVNKELRDATSNARANAVSLNAYLAIVNDTTKSEKERNGALLALKEAGIAVDDLNIKTAAGLSQLNARVQDSINLSIQKAIVDKAASKIAEIELKRIEDINEAQKSQNGLMKTLLGERIAGAAAASTEVYINQNAAAATSLYTEAIKNASAAVAQLTPNVDAANTAQTNYNKSVKQGAKKAAKDLEDLNKQVASEFKRHELEKIKIADDASRLALEKQKLSQTNLLEQLKTDQLLEIDAIKSKYNDQIEAKKILDKELEKQVTTKIGVDGNKLTEGQVQALINQRKNISDEIVAIEQNMATAIENTTNGQIKATSNLLDLQLKERQSYNAEVYGLTLDLVNAQTDLENKALSEKLKQYGFTENEISKLLTKRKNEASERFEQNAAKLESDRAYFQELANIYNDDTLTQKQRAKEIENLNNSRVAKNLSIELDLLKQKQIAGEEETQLYKERAAKIAEIEAQMASNSVAIVESTNKKLQASLTQINAAFATLQSEAAVSFGQFIGDLVSGEQDAGKNFGKNMLGAIASFMDSLGKALIATAIASEAFQKLILTNPLAAAAAGVALVAGAQIVRNSLKEGPEVTAFAEGGIVSGPTLGLMGEYPNARSNPEVIAPLDKLQGMLNTGSQSGYVASTTITGRDLAIVLERYNKDSKRG